MAGVIWGPFLGTCWGLLTSEDTDETRMKWLKTLESEVMYFHNTKYYESTKTSLAGKVGGEAENEYWGHIEMNFKRQCKELECYLAYAGGH